MKTLIALLTALALPASAAVISFRYDAAGRLTNPHSDGMPEINMNTFDPDADEGMPAGILDEIIEVIVIS